MKAHQIDADGRIVNTIVVESLDVFPDLVDASVGGSIGDRLVNGEIIHTGVATSLPDSIPMLNLKLVLIDDGKYAAFETIVNGMEGDDGDRARAYVSAALTARRDNYLVNQLWPVLGYDLAGFNDAWARAAALNP